MSALFKKLFHGTDGKASFSEKFSYAFGCMSYNFEIVVITTYLILFSTDVMNINPMIVGALFFVIRFIDAITDVTITHIADKTRTKWGRYRPWMLMGIPLAFALVLSFWNPSFLHSQWQMIVWLGVCLIIVDIFETSTYMPVMVLGTTMSSDKHDRLDFASSRTLGEYAAELIVGALCMTTILYFGDYKDTIGWRYMSILFAVFIIIASVIGFFGTKERVFAPNKNKKGEQLNLRKKLSVLKHNKPFFKVLSIQVAFALQWLLTMILFTYFCIYNLGHEEWLPILTISGTVATIAATAILPFLGRRMEKRTLVFVGCISILLSAAILIYANDFTSVLIFQILKGIGSGILFSTVGAMWPEVTDYTEWKTGIAAPGIIIAVGLFCFKIFNAFSSYAAGAVLSLGGYDSTLEVQSDFTLTALRMSMIIGTVIFIALTMIINAILHELSAKKLATYHEDLKSRENSSMNEVEL